MHEELNKFIPEDKIERIKKLSDVSQTYLTDLYINSLKNADEQSRDIILKALEHDIETLENQVDSKNISFNKEREDGFVQLEQKLQELLKTDPTGKGMERWLADSINNIFKIDADKLFLASDFTSVEIVFAQSATAAVLTNRNVSRPILVFHDNAQFAKLRSIFSAGESSNGFFAPITGRGKMPSHIHSEFQPLANAGLLVSKPNSNTTLSHEIRHSIDPLMLARDGFNSILSELYAYSTQMHLNKEKLKSILNHSGYVTQNLKDESEIDKANKEKGGGERRQFGEKVKNEETHKILVEYAVETFFKDIQKMGTVKALRRLGTQSSLEEYLDFRFKLKLRDHFAST